MSFNGSEGSFISLNDAADLTANYRLGQLNPTLGHFLGSEKLQTLLDQDGCVGLRIYYGLNGEGGKEIIVVGVDSSEDDILDTEPLILDTSVLCPPTCSSSNDLNS